MGIIIASAKTIEDRRRVCTQCVSYNEQLGTCKACKCLVELKIKIKQSQCPRGKWFKQND